LSTPFHESASWGPRGQVSDLTTAFRRLAAAAIAGSPLPAARPAAAAHAHPLQGVLLICLAAAFFASLDSLSRGLGATAGRWAAPVLLLMTVRYAVQAIVMAIVLAPRGRAGFRSANPLYQGVRGGLLLATSCCSFFGVQYMPVPEFTAINMLTPLLVTVLAAFVLHERASMSRWLLVAGGFVGALIVIRPGSGMFGLAVVLPLAGACTYAIFQVLTSRLAGTEDPLTTHFYTGAVGTLGLLPALGAAAALQGSHAVYATVLRLSWDAWALMIAAGLLGTLGHLMLILALGKARTATLMPFLYTQIGFAAFIGFVAFDHVPDHWAWVGMGVIAACGATSAALNLRRPGARSPAAAVDVAPE
jgi:drug/metabolite transporter (DMT)-like permease